jgi:pilus assembly protein CpaB
MLAAVAAVLAAIVVFSALKKREAEVQRAMATSVDIVVAAHDLRLGTKIDQIAVKLARWSRDAVPAGAFTDPQALMNSYVKSQFVANEPIIAAKLYMGEKTAGVMPLLIPPGMRAMSVPVDEVSDIAGFVQPGTRVDVLVAVSGSGQNQQSFSKIVLQNVEVLAVAQEIERTKDEPQVVKVVTLLVSPEGAEKLALASREGTLRLAMRNYSDQKIIATAGVSVSDLLHGGWGGPTIQNQHVASPERGARAHRPGPPPVSVEIMRDGKPAESISFINAALPGHARLMVPVPAPRAPVTALPPPPAPVANLRAPAAPPVASAGVGGGGPRALAAEPAAAPIARAIMGATGSAGAATPHGPAPKTIEIH